MKSWTLHLLVPSLLAAVACQQVSGDDLDAGSNDTDDGTADQNEEAEGNDAEASGDGDGDGDNTGDGGGDGDGDGPCAGQSVALRLITGADAPGFGAGAVFESFGPQPQAREGVLVFTAYVIGGDAPPGTEALYRWDMVNETEPVLVAATGFAIPGTGLSPLGFNGLAVLAEDLSVGYQVVVSGEVHVLAYEGTEHREIIAEGVGTGPGATTIEFIPPFSNFDRGAAYFSGSFVSWVRVADPLGGAPDYAVFSREHEDDGSYLLQSDSIVGLPAGHAWVPQEEIGRAHV